MPRGPNDWVTRDTLPPPDPPSPRGDDEPKTMEELLQRIQEGEKMAIAEPPAKPTTKPEEEVILPPTQPDTTREEPGTPEETDQSQ